MQNAPDLKIFFIMLVMMLSISNDDFQSAKIICRSKTKQIMIRVINHNKIPNDPTRYENTTNNQYEIASNTIIILQSALILILVIFRYVVSNQMIPIIIRLHEGNADYCRISIVYFLR